MQVNLKKQAIIVIKTQFTPVVLYRISYTVICAKRQHAVGLKKINVCYL